MDTTIVLNNLLSLIRSMPLTTSNKEWLASELRRLTRKAYWFSRRMAASIQINYLFIYLIP